LVQLWGLTSFALSANYAYLNQAETTIKSILYNNRFVKVYLFNYDIPQEWFININQYVNQIGSKIVDAKFDHELLQDVHSSYKNINDMAYARFLISKIIPEERVIYLDSDLIVDKSIDKLFEIPFNKNLIMAVPDYGYIDKPYYKNIYNDGVMVINNQALKKIPGISDKLLNLGRNPNLSNGDQTVINDYFNGRIGSLSDEYNYQIGFDRVAFWNKHPKLLNKLNSIKYPKIIHYLTNDKPFNFQSTGRLREKWWFYRNLELSAIVQRYSVFDRTKIGPQNFRGQVFIFTRRAEIGHLKALIKALPDVCFNIGAYTDAAWILTELVKYPNLKLYTNIIGSNVQHLINQADVYLDINFGPKEKEVINRVKAQNIPILTFKYTSDQENTYGDYTIFDDDDIAGMAARIKKILAEKYSE
jgi:lipopolysaccharide biosynthesis glycosyltransferase